MFLPDSFQNSEISQFLLLPTGAGGMVGVRKLQIYQEIKKFESNEITFGNNVKQLNIEAKFIEGKREVTKRSAILANTFQIYCQRKQLQPPVPSLYQLNLDDAAKEMFIKEHFGKTLAEMIKEAKQIDDKYKSRKRNNSFLSREEI